MFYSPFRVNSPRLVPIILFFFTFFTSPFARAQQWTIPDAAGNINNTNTGNVGIGTSTPGAKLEVNGIVRITASTSAGNYLSVGAYNPVTDNFGYISSAGQANGTGLKFETANDAGVNWGATRMVILNNGNVGIGTTNPGYPLDVNGVSHVNGMFVTDAPQAGNISTWIRGYASANLVLQGGIHPGSAWEAYWITATNGVLKIGANGGAEAAVGAVNINDNGDVGIGTTTPKAKLAVNGDILAKKVTVSLNNLPDYVFDKQYPLPTLPDLEKYIQQNRHLPEMPSADSVAKHGLDLGSSQAVLLKKIEELTLYIIQQNKTIENMKQRLDAVEADKQR